MCKTHNGIIGITRKDQARDRFCITWSQRCKISQDVVRHLFNLSESEGTDEDDDSCTAKSRSYGISRRNRDVEDVKKLKALLKTYMVFKLTVEVDTISEKAESNPLFSLATKDIATAEITNDLLNAEKRGTEAVFLFFSDRLISQNISFFDTMKKINSKTFAHLYRSVITTRNNVQKDVKAGRNLMQRLLNAVNSGRPIDMSNVLKHELSLVPYALAMANGKMRSTTKAELMHILKADSKDFSSLPDSDLATCYIVDGHAHIQSLQKPKGCKTFGDYAKIFFRSITKHFHANISRVDVVFDRYYGHYSIKSFTRQERTQKKRPIRKYISSTAVPLPESWPQFIALEGNKADLARFLSEYLTKQEIEDEKELVIGGGFADAILAWSSKHDVSNLKSNHEEADTRMVLHARHALERGYRRIIVASADTDVMVLLLHFIAQNADETWMAAGTPRHKRYYALHIMVKCLSATILTNLPGFHAFTGCDTTSSFFGYGKKSCWDINVKNPDLLGCVGRDGHIRDAEKFTMELYHKSESKSLDEARHQLFTKAKKQLEKLPPTVDALELHFCRANYQARIWYQATTPFVVIEKPEDTNGWRKGKEGEGLEIVWTRLPPISQSAIEITSCGCTAKCGTSRCTCFKSGLICIPACGCDAENCGNPSPLSTL